MARVEGSSCVQYRFKSSNEFDTLWFDGEGISLNDLKARILDQKKMTSTSKGSKTNEFDLAIANAQSGEEYTDYHVLVPRNTALIVKRVPLHRKLTLTSKRGTVELGLQGDGGDEGARDASVTGAPAGAPAAADEAPLATAAPKSLTELQPGVALLLYCPLCGQLLRSAAIASCCASTYCDECIREQLSSAGACPSCGVPSASIELLPNVQMQTVVSRHAEAHPEQLAGGATAALSGAQGGAPLLGGLGGAAMSLEDAAEAAMRSMMQSQQHGPGGMNGASGAPVGVAAEMALLQQQQAAMMMQQQMAGMLAMQSGGMMMPHGHGGMASAAHGSGREANGWRRGTGARGGRWHAQPDG